MNERMSKQPKKSLSRTKAPKSKTSDSENLHKTSDTLGGTLVKIAIFILLVFIAIEEIEFPFVNLHFSTKLTVHSTPRKFNNISHGTMPLMNFCDLNSQNEICIEFGMPFWTKYVVHVSKNILSFCLKT